ncbi:MAG: MBL fold metallo-hydrolase [Coriobacteriaceae bacterium]|nr:MBL fold metallo-hydrolase [Coriobacteriaceae bacterium]
MARFHKVKDLCVDVMFSILGPIATNVYVIDDGEGVIVVDPACRPDAIMQMVGDRTVDAIFVTHRHEDHIGALADMRRLTGAKVYAPAIEANVIEAGVESKFGLSAAACPVDVRYHDGDVLKVGKTSWKVIHTPGHTEGSSCFYLKAEDAPGAGLPVLVSGDTLFCSSIGRTDFEGGNMKQMRQSLRRLGQLPDDVVVLPGHNMLTTMKAEKRTTIPYYAG